MNYDIAYTDTIVRNLVYISELNALINSYLNSIDKFNPKFIDLENDSKSEILFDFLHCMNVGVKFKDARKFALGMNRTPENSKERVLLNVRNVIDYINASYNNEKLGIGFLIHINKLFLDGIKDNWDSGKMINREDDIDSSFDLAGNYRVIFQNDAINFVKSLEEYFSGNGAPEVIKTSVLFYKLTKNKVFECGNDACALASLMFLYKKIGFNRFVNYYKCINSVMSAGLSEGGELDLNVWLDAFFNELSKELKEIRNKLSPFVDDINTEMTKYVDLNLRQIKGLTYIKEKGPIGREIYSKLNSISQITAYRDLNNMLQKGYVRVEGIGKGTKYAI